MKYLFIGGNFNGHWREANGDKEIVFCELLRDSWNMVCYVRQTWVQGESCLFRASPQNPGLQEIYVLDSLTPEEATQLVNRR